MVNFIPSCKTVGDIQHKCGTDSIGFVEREQVGGVLSGPGPEVVSNIPKGIEGMEVFPFLRILGAQKAVIAEAMINFDVELIYAVLIRSGTEEVIEQVEWLT